jgi:3-oxoacyl-[acyl-carrier protein] reductase
MKDKIALVTGSSRGLGRGLALRLATVVGGVGVHYFREQEKAGDVVRQIQQAGKQAAAFQSDLETESGALDLIRQVEDEFGRLDILVNNFGPMQVKPWREVSHDEWEHIFRATLLSALHCMRGALPGMRERQWGRIINIGYSRVEQLTSFQTITPYAVAKTGLLILTRSAAVSEAPAGITVNMVSPGLLEGGMAPKTAKVPAGRLGSFTDISAAVLYLVSAEAGYVTGNNLVVAGGWKL